ncbi:MAG: hypothetical protein Q8942_03275 [Bacillota bacterium]|nr:hypothetical protein [Bacillota bacterium]
MDSEFVLNSALTGVEVKNGFTKVIQNAYDLEEGNSDIETIKRINATISDIHSEEQRGALHTVGNVKVTVEYFGKDLSENLEIIQLDLPFLFEGIYEFDNVYLENLRLKINSPRRLEICISVMANNH